MSAIVLTLYLGMFACLVIVLIHAFKTSVGQALLCMFVPLYILYYAFARFEHQKKNLILGILLGCWALTFIVGVSSGAFSSTVDP